MAPTPDQYNGYDEFFLEYDKYKYPAFRYDYIAFNLKNPLFEDRRVRTAIAHGINIQEIIAGVYQGLAVQATGPFPQASWAFNKDVPPISYDVEKAKSLLKEAGWTDSDGDGFLDKGGQKFAFTLILNQGNTVRESIAQIAQSNLKDLGIDVTVRILEWSVFIHKYIDEGQFDACVLAWSLSRDPDCTTIWHSSEIGKAKYNFVGYKNPEVDQLLVEGRETFDLARRQKIYRRIHALIADDVPYVFLVNPMSLPVIHKKLRGVELAPAGLGLLGLLGLLGQIRRATWICRRDGLGPLNP
jgi:peptide/nickel transport system substrate-binding protein